MQLEDYVGAETAAIGHGAGVSKHSVAELAGMVADDVVSTGGSYVINDGLDGHVRIAQGAAANPEGIEAIVNEIGS